MMKLGTLLAIGLYLVMVAAVVGGLFVARRKVVAEYGTTQAQADWEVWIEEAKKQEKGSGPVQREAPRSARPPALVLMQEHFVTCVAGALLISSALYWTMAFFVYGALKTPTSVGDGKKN